MPAMLRGRPAGAGDSMDDAELTAFHRARRHSGLVRMLRIILPLAAVFILSLLIGAYIWSQSGVADFGADSVSMENGRMVMRNPDLNGVDPKGRPYRLQAREAVQNPAAPSKVELVDIDATLPVEENISARLLAGNGFYDADAKQLKLSNKVNVTTNDGATIDLEAADVDIYAGRLITDQPVSLRTDQASITAQKLAVEDNGKRIVFEDRVRMVLYPAEIRKVQQQSTENNGEQ
jgi:lipopolysaccharide export system protein LptC